MNNLPESLGSAVAVQERLGGGQFLKSIKVVNEDGALVVKVYAKRDSPSLTQYEEALASVRERLTVHGAPNVMPYRWFKETPHAAYLVRQYFHSNLLERMSTPPFLTLVEKRWMAFQLLQALQQCDSAGVCHGDIKLENVMVTSWNWVFLCDLANFKPSILPQDDPSDFNYFFASSRRAACALAPERFVETSPAPAAQQPPEAPGLQQFMQPPQQLPPAPTQPQSAMPPSSGGMSSGQAAAGLQPASDVFSCGCVLLELFLEDGPPFELPTLLRYTRGEATTLDESIGRVTPSGLSTLLQQMTKRHPTDRPSAARCLQLARGAVLDECFYSFAFGFFGRLRLMDQDAQAAELCDHFDLLIR